MLRGRIIAIAAARVRYGYRRIHVLLQREGWKVNAKRVARLYTLEGLNLRAKGPKRRRRSAAQRIRLSPAGPNQVWSMDFMHDTLKGEQRRKFRLLNIVDVFTRECLAIEVAPGFKACGRRTDTGSHRRQARCSNGNPLRSDGDVLPVRAKYGSNAWQIGVNYLYASRQEDALWYAWPDLVASVLLTGKIPRIVEAFRIKPIGEVDLLTPIAFRGRVPINPRRDDFFRKVIEERKRLASRKDIEPAERERLDKALKTFGSATAYGIFAQMDRQESDKKVRLQCYGIDDSPYACAVSHPEAPGEYCFPPLASLVTSGGRLFLSLLERLVTDRGGTYAMEDTDSMAIAATRGGGPVACPGGPLRMRGGREAIRALSWGQVQEIVDLFARLNPYDREAVRGSILEIEDDNFDPKSGKQRQLVVLRDIGKALCALSSGCKGRSTVFCAPVSIMARTIGPSMD